MANSRRTLLIFGAGGDLTTRLLLPALGQLISVKPDTDVEVIGVNQLKLSPGDWRELVKKALTDGGLSEEKAAPFVDASSFISADITDSGDLKRVLAAASGAPALYFAVPPAVAVASVKALQELDLPDDIVLALEKPFGTDLASAQAFNRELEQLVPENRIHRVDHFFGKSNVLNLLGVRFANRLMENSWNRDSIDRVEIVYDEALGLEGRAGYYDKAGALIDMIQSHLLSVLAVVAMEAPSNIDPDDLRGAMAQALRAVQAHPEHSHRGRYTAGDIDGRQLPSYVDSDGVDPARGTETLAQVEVTVDNWRWAGVPFILRSGKAIGQSRKELVVTFKSPPHLPGGLKGAPAPATFTMGLETDEIELALDMNGGGDPFDIDRVKLEADFGKGQLRAYGEVLQGILHDDPLLSLRGDMVEENWRIVEPVIAAWHRDEVPLDDYAAGSGGPDWSI